MPPLSPLRQVSFVAVGLLTLHSLSCRGLAGELSFEADIRPIFRAHCFDCHGATEDKEGSLDLRLVRFLKRGGDSGPAISGDQPASSLLLARVKSGEMPPGESRLSDKEIAVLDAWVRQGTPTLRPEPETIGPGLGITEEERSFWAFQPIQRPSLPPAEQMQDRHSIDALLIAGLPEGMGLSLEADRPTLVKRAYLGLIGLPPSFVEMQHWTNLAAADWYEQMLDELLASKHYGERWARHWLDVAGYADSEGYATVDAERAWSWRYRDWVIRALNADMPYDEFLTRQLAGDELAGVKQGDWTPEQIELLTATGFLRMAADGTGSGANTIEGRNQVMADTLKIVCSAIMGVSVHCAQCHDHRYDPIPQKDYFALRAAFEPALDPKAWKAPAQRRVSLYTAADRETAQRIEADAAKVLAKHAKRQAELMAQALEAELMKFDEPLRTTLKEAYQTPAGDRTEVQKQLLKANPSINITTGNLYQYIPSSRPELKKLTDEAAAIRSKKPVEEFIRAIVEPPNHQPVTHLFHRGDPHQPRQPVAPGGLSVVAPPHEPPTFAANDPSLPTSGRRLALARWLTNGEHPLTARVIANRVWMHHFGRGLVNTPADFGRLGQRPSHPRLLDHLAKVLVDNGWRLKSLHREIMLSSVYRQQHEGAGNAGPSSEYASKPIIRLEAEAIRDRILHATGALKDTMFGAPTPVKLDPSGTVFVEDNSRRSIYIQVRRSQPVAMLRAFDLPVMETNCECRSVSTVATQSLMMMNSRFLLEQAKGLADRARRESSQVESTRLLESVGDSLSKIPDLPENSWEFGSGWWDAEENQTHFEPFAHWTGSRWQGGEKLPDTKIGWAFLTATGGHPGGDKSAVIRRWRAPANGRLSITGELRHPSENGNGVHALVVSDKGVRAEWHVFHGKQATNVEAIDVAAGDVIDLIIDRKGSETSDSFEWPVTLTLVTDERTTTFESQGGFHGPIAGEPQVNVPAQLIRAWQLALARDPSPEELQLICKSVADQVALLLDRQQEGVDLPDGVTALDQAVTNVCQALLSCNEFLYVD